MDKIKKRQAVPSPKQHIGCRMLPNFFRRNDGTILFDYSLFFHCARLISLAINIAVMGFILQEGILSYLKRVLPGTLDITQLRTLAEKIAAGNTTSLKQGLPELSSLDASGAVVHAALVHGFGLVMLYGGIGVGFWPRSVL